MVLLTYQARLVRVRSPLLTEYRLISFPTGTEMFQFPAFALLTLYIQVKSTCLNRRSSIVPTLPSKPQTGQGPARSVRLHSREDTKTTDNLRLSGGFPHSDIPGSKGALASPGLIAECHVLHRLLLPRHPPNALIALDPIQKKTGPLVRRRFKPSTHPIARIRSLRPDGAPSAGRATAAKSERPGAHHPQPDRPHGQCVLRLGKTVSGCPAARSAARGLSSSRNTPVAHSVRSPLGTDPKTSRVFALFTMSICLILRSDRKNHRRVVLPVSSSSLPPPLGARADWWVGEELNLRPHAYQACALTT